MKAILAHLIKEVASLKLAQGSFFTTQSLMLSPPFPPLLPLPPLFPQMMFYLQDSDDVYGLFRFHPEENQNIQSQPDGRFLSLSFLREGGTLGEVALALTALYIPAGPVDPGLARDGVLNGSRSTTVLFSQGQDLTRLTLPIRNDAFLQNGAHFLIQVGPEVSNGNTFGSNTDPVIGSLSQGVGHTIHTGEVSNTVDKKICLFK